MMGVALDENENIVDRFMICEIIFDDGSFELYPTNGRVIDITSEMEFIGNIYENPELFNDKDEG